MGGQVEVVFNSGEKGEEVFFKLQAYKFFGAHIAKTFGAGGVVLIPGVGDGLGEKVDPAAIGGREGEGGAERGGGDVDGCFIELNVHSAYKPVP